MRNSEFQLNIISAKENLFSGKVTSVVAPGASGRFGVYPDHAPMISPLQKGVIVYTIDGNEKSLEVGGGIVEINNNEVTICVI